MGGQSTEDDVVCKAKLQDLQCFVAPEAIRYKYTWFAISDAFGLGIEHTREPRMRMYESVYLGILPPRSGKCGVVAPVSRGWPDGYRV